MLLCFVHIVFWIELPVQRRLCHIIVIIMDPGKWDITVRNRVTRYPRVFCKLTVGQQTPGFEVSHLRIYRYLDFTDILVLGFYGYIENIGKYQWIF